MTAASAADIADRYATALNLQESFALREPTGYGKWLVESNVYQALNDGRHTTVKPPPPPSRMKEVRELTYIGQDSGVKRLWQRNRIVYDIDPDLWEALGNTSPDDTIPAGLFQRLPHPDPFVALPSPLLIPLEDGLRMRVEGFFVVGRGQSLQATQVSTHSPAAVGNLGLLIGGAVESYSGKAHTVPGLGGQDYVWNRVTVTRETTTVAQLIESIRSRFDTAEEIGDFDQVLPQTITACVSALVYLCSTNAELRPLPASANKRQAKGGRKPPKIVQVGYLTGPALRAYKASERSESAATGRAVRPHIRRAHFHTYKVGPGRTESVVKWLAPIPINVTQDATKATIVKIH